MFLGSIKTVAVVKRQENPFVHVTHGRMEDGRLEGPPLSEEVPLQVVETGVT